MTTMTTTTMTTTTTTTTTTTPQSPATRPEDLSVTPWYQEDHPTSDTSPGPIGNRSSYPSYSYADRDSKLDLNSTRNSSLESEFPTVPIARKACMDLKTAMELLDETCPNVEPSPSLTPRTPRTPYATRSKRARSKSSDNSSNYSNDRLSDRSFETAKDKEKKRPFLKKIGISKTEDRPFLAKLAPRIIGKPYLQKIGPSKAIEKPFLDKIGSSKTLSKFIFDTSRNERKNEPRTKTNDAMKNHETKNNIRHEIEQVAIKEDIESLTEVPETTPIISYLEQVPRKPIQSSQTTFERRRSGKEFLLKMYSFETEDLESTVPPKERNTLHGTSLDDVLDSGPSSLPTDNSDEPTESRQELEKRPTAELLKCRVTTSEEIISSSTTCLNSPGETTSWSNSPRKAQRAKKESATMIRRRIFQGSHEVVRSDNSMPNSPTKRPISSISPDREIESTSRNNGLERGTLSPTKTRKSNIEGIRTVENTRRSIKYNQFERRGISSDNLLAKDALSFVTAARTMTDNIGRTREISSEDSLTTHREYTRETFKQLQDKFRLQEIPMESYAAFKRRTKAVPGFISRQERLNLLPGDLDMTIKIKTRTENVAPAADNANASETAVDKRDRSQEGTVRSILRKQEGIDHPDQESDSNASIRRPMRRIFHEPSQETMDLLTELRKVKSLLKTPSWEKDLDVDQKPARTPKRILLTDKEFCLSVERENSVRRPSRILNSLETTEKGKIISNQENKENNSLLSSNETTKTVQKSSGPALFEKKCLSLDYADEDKPQKPEARAISLASTRDLPSETEETDDYPDLALICDSKSCSSSVFNSPSEETNKKDFVDDEPTEANGERSKKLSQNHCAEVDIAIPIDQKMNSSKGEGVQGRTSDLYEIISPRSTPFRVKKRLGKISVEETVKPENFTLGSKVDCRSVVAQKRTKCFPL
ncbi:cell wall protein DAN4 [Solenopsis invicta]|uniref:cell wall protein DAN4 n=1 Tax=Solenopsis invicta TaxID=13686 RepID=UPI000E33FFC9|nr:cell wall protein DAN4 [Solenopsis invicta]